ncbi:tetratricopeptide repeat protein [Schleiferiaceae bacterium]|nr:tetratricopeptide repeat protein [Schleiferiaceae bacterium]MDA9908524.1 tetratricopeptide repeat protein [Schleiferiaceae bacterium]
MKKSTLIAFFGAVVIALVVWQLPRTPHQDVEAITSEEGNPLDAKVDEAVAIIQNGEGAPMQAIGMLLEVLREDPNHEKALLWLGNFSMMSGQWEKAVDRFHQLSQLHPENELYTLNKVQALMQVGDTTAALTSANNYLNTYPDANRVKDFAEGL